MNRHSLKTLVVLTAVAASAAWGGWAYAQGAGTRSVPVLTAQDHVEITQLYARFNQGSDFRNADLWLSTFAEDGIFTLPNGKSIAGQDALSKWRAESFRGKQGDSKRRHIHGSINLAATEDGGAHGRAYWVVLDVSGKQPALASTGYVDDVFVKTAGGWRFKTHTVYSDASGD